MPHVNIKHFPKELDDESKQRLAQEISALIQRHFDTYDGAVSIALEPVDPADWNEVVSVPEITGRRGLLIKEPNYRP